jgi:hypothetical protein
LIDISTLNLTLFSLFLPKITSYSDALLTIADRNSLYSGYIKSASSKFVQCDTDLSLRVDVTGVTELFNGNGATATFTMVSTAVTGSEYVVLVSGTTSVSGTAFTVSGNVFTFATGYIPATGTSTVSLSWEFAGEFTEDLTELEQEIITNMMVLEWLKPNVYHMDLLEYRLGSKDFQMFSPGNHLKELRSLKKDTESEIDSLIIKYSYNNDLSNLA